MTPVKTQGEEVDMVQFYKYLGEHIINRLDRTNKICCTIDGRILLFKTITSISDGQHTALYTGV